jgi:hypothetical protein
MRVAAVYVMALGLSQTLYAQQGTVFPSPPEFQCAIGEVPHIEKAPFPELQKRLETLPHREFYGCAGRGHLQWAEKISFPEAKTGAACENAQRHLGHPQFAPLQPLRIEDAGYSSDPAPRVVLLFRLANGRQVQMTFPPDDRAWQSDDPLPILAYESGLYVDPYNSPFTSGEVEAIQNKNFQVGMRMEVLGCAYGSWPGFRSRDGRAQHWSIFDEHAYRFDSNGRIAEIRAVKEPKP